MHREPPCACRSSTAAKPEGQEWRTAGVPPGSKKFIFCTRLGEPLSRAKIGSMRRPFAVLAMAIAIIGLFTGGLAWVLETPHPRPGASRAERIYQGLCATCHGTDGRGSWRARLFLIRPGDLTGPEVQQDSDQYLVDIIKNGG